jgi:hypothetical protein
MLLRSIGVRMARLIYVAEISNNTFLHLSIHGETVKLRDFSKSSNLEPVPFSPPGITPEKIEKLINQPPNMHRPGEPKGQKDPGVSGKDAIAFWHRYIVDLNRTLIPVSHEDLARKIDLDKKVDEASTEWWKKVRMIILVITALVGLAGAIFAFWR